MGYSCCFPVAAPALLCPGSQLWGKHKAEEEKKEERERGSRERATQRCKGSFCCWRKSWVPRKQKMGPAAASLALLCLCSVCVCVPTGTADAAPTQVRCFLFICETELTFWIDYVAVSVVSHISTSCLDKILKPFTGLWAYVLNMCVHVCRWDQGLDK